MRTRNGEEPPRGQRTASRAKAAALARAAAHAKDTEHRKGSQVTEPNDETVRANVGELGAATKLAVAGFPILDPVGTNSFIGKDYITTAIRHHRVMIGVSRPVHRQEYANDPREGQTDWENEDLTGTATKAEAMYGVTLNSEGNATAKGI